ncbi:hypothetical protein CBOM_05624 [Ceraceosorus bombacis]|uniref:Uncharacterized protein n=1 Tax=Ceraceosorus bombacis TaxID=401625 RepID=A0A0P1BRY1_9BASI|nr:hypothetical protein CBOM_05624 [Ceraceosorus bombacis]
MSETGAQILLGNRESDATEVSGKGPVEDSNQQSWQDLASSLGHDALLRGSKRLDL